MKTICIYHSRDLDGWMSAAVVKKWYGKATNDFNTEHKVVSDSGDQLDFLGWDYGDDIPDLSKYDKIIMCDVSFPKDDMINLQYKLDNNFIWIDHHISAINNNLVSLKEGIEVPIFNGLRDTNFAACELTWKYFFPNEEIPEIVRLLGMYDSFRHKGTDEEQKVLEFQYGARQCISNYEEAYDYLIQEISQDEMIWNPDLISDILDIGKTIYLYLYSEAKQTYKKAFSIELYSNPLDEVHPIVNTHEFLCVNQERFNPINFGIDYHKDGYDGFACFWYKDGKWMWSLYNDNGKVDCSQIAKQYGGGGHKGASGFVCNTNMMLKLINN